MASQDAVDDDEKAQLAKQQLAEACEKEGLDSKYWVPRLSKILGVKSVEALKHVCYEDYLKLECEVQNTWEKRALQTLLQVTDHRANLEELQKKRLEKIKEKQAVAQKALEEVKEMRRSGSHSRDAMKQKQEALWQAMDIPKEYWLPLEESLADVLENIQAQLEQLESTVDRSENISDVELLKRASGGLALQGIYRGRSLDDVLEKREQLIKVPEGFKFAGPEQGSLFEKREFSSAEAESAFTKSMEKLGLSISVSAKAGFWGFKAEADGDYDSSSRSEKSHHSHSEQRYISTTKYKYIPLASCFFQKDQLRLSDAALQELQGIDHILNISQEADRANIVKKRCEDFFCRFGSHVNQGSIHFGGIFWWKASVKGFREDQREEMKEQLSKALTGHIAAGFGGFGIKIGGTTDFSKSSFKASSQGEERRSGQVDIQLSITKTGGPPEIDSLPQWKQGLVISNTTWCVVDRGFRLIPVWEIILSNHRDDFKSIHQVSSSLQAAYGDLTNHSVGIMFGEELISAVEEAKGFMEQVKTWEMAVDEKKLNELLRLKRLLNEKTRNHSVWINICLSDRALQEFLVNTVLLCKDSPPDNILTIKCLMRCLLDPYIYSVKDFLKSSVIVEWIFQTENTLPETFNVSKIEDLTKTLKEMKEHIQEVTYTPWSSASAVHTAKVKATMTASLAVSSLLQFLQERKQKDVELLLLLVTTSTGYHVEGSTFQCLLGWPEINFMINEIETGHKDYLNLKEQDVYRAEAFLLQLGLVVTPDDRKLPPEQKKERFAFMKKQMENSWCPEIETLLQKYSTLQDWEALESDLRSFIQGCVDDTRDDLKQASIIKDMEDTFQPVEPPPLPKAEPDSDQSKANKAEANKKFFHLLQRLGLENHYPRKMGTEDFHVIHKTTLHNSQPSKESELPLYFLQKLLMVDYRVRYLTYKEVDSLELPLVPDAPQEKSETSDDSFDDFLRVDEEAPESTTKSSHVHPMDLQMAIFHCADNFMRQYLFSKLAFCQFALPLLVPNPCTSEIEFSFWALSQIKKSWKEAKKSGEQTQISSYKNKLIYQAETPIVSFVRIGSSPSSSKSQILNILLSKQKHNTFFNRHCESSTKDCLLVKGVVEISWYCPNGTDNDSFGRCVAFCNLHGDARDHDEQLHFLQEISAVNVVFINESDQGGEKGMVILRQLWQSQRPLICLFTEKESVVASHSSQNIRLGIKNRNEAELIGELTKTIRALLERSNVLFSLEACADIARKHQFVVDEDTEACVAGKEKAKALVKLLKQKKLSEMKSQLLPLQGKLWHLWCKKDKELTRLQDKKNMSIEHHRSQIEAEKQSIRNMQLEKAFPFNKLMRPVLMFLQTQPADTKRYFLQWMKVFMDDLCSDHLDELKQRYHQLWQQILALKKNSDKTDQVDLLVNTLDALANEITDSSIGLEHILREVGQIYEALEPKKSKNKFIIKLPEIAADLMVSGYPIELMDGDASYVPLRWVSAIFDRLIQKLGDKKVFVLSVLGIQSTGKSTLLNAMFGLEFSVSAGRCTRGAFMQLIKVDTKAQQDLDFDYVLVVDTEGLRALELENKRSLNHDNELATFVIGIGNMTLINIFGENPSEMQDVIQIAVQAFLRMKQVHLSPSCLFVHQNVGEISARELNMEGQRRLQEKLDEMTVIAARQEFCDVSCFSNVIRFDVNTHIHYFAHLWEGNPPMAPPNPTYSQNVQELKSKILQAAKKEAQGNILKLSNLKTRIGDLWNALLNENFVFSFKNSMEIAAFNKKETMYKHWTWQLRSCILELQMKLDNKIRNGDLGPVTSRYLEEQVQETSNNVMKDMERFFAEDKDHEILIQWRDNTVERVKNEKESLLLETRRKCENLIELRKSQCILEEKKSLYESMLLQLSRELALKLKGERLSEKQLRDHFLSLWAGWVAEVSSHYSPPKEVDVDVDIENVLLENFKESKVHTRITSASRSPQFSLDLDKHITKKKHWLFFSTDLDAADKDRINLITETIIANVKANIDKKEKEKWDYSKSFIHEILHEVEKGMQMVPRQAKYSFNTNYRIDLSLYLCRSLAPRFKAMQAEFRRANDPTTYLNSKKEDFFKCFQISCQGATSITTFAIFLCDKISPALSQEVYKRTALAITRDMQSKSPELNGNRSSLEVFIMKNLAQEEKFDDFKLYLFRPEAYLKSYFESRVRKYCSENGRLTTFLCDSLTHLYESIQLAVSVSSDVVKGKEDRSDKISLWLDKFCSELKEVLCLPRKELKGIEHQEIKDIEFLNSAMTEALGPMRDSIKEELAKANLSSFEMPPHIILAEQFAGCWEQCPFCRAVCTNTIRDHDGDHQLVVHRPSCLGGFRWYKTDNLVIDICSSSVVSDNSFLVGEDKWIPFKQYREAGPPYNTWKILPDPSMRKYWKWFVSHFRTELETLFNGKFEGKGELPEAWQKVSKEEVLEELKDLQSM